MQNQPVVSLKTCPRRNGEPIALLRAEKQRRLFLRGIMLLSVIWSTGCKGANHYYAEKMPSSLRLLAQTNAQEVDLSRLASSTGGSETIGPGDVLEVSIAAGLSEKDRFTHPARVNDDGTITLPDIGTVTLAGYPPEAAESLIRMEAIRKGFFLDPAVTVMITHARMNHVRVLGAVENPGTYPLSPTSSDIVSAIAAAGGLTENAGEEVEVRNPARRGSGPRPSVAGGPAGDISPVSSTETGNRTEPVSSKGHEPEASGRQMNSYTINLISAAKEGEGSYTIQDGGVVMVEERKLDPIQVLGLVRKPDSYEIKPGEEMTVLGAIAMAGGVSNQLANKIYVIRPVLNSSNPAVIEVSMRKAVHSGLENVRVGPGDIVKVEQTPATVMLEALQIIRFGISGSLGTFF